MSDKHITDILDNQALRDLTEAEQVTIRRHTEECADCRQAFAAAQVSALLVKERVSEAGAQTLNANPFFQTRVLAAWREQEATNTWSLQRWWQAAGAMMASMAAITAMLAVLTLVMPGSEPANQPTATVIPTSAEAVVLDQGAESLTDDQVLSAIYDDDEGK
jgi:hypothetical protein